MKLKKLRSTLLRLRFMTLLTDKARVGFLRRHKVIRSIGDNLSWATRYYPVDGSRLIIHDNVSIARAVNFIMHDEMHLVLNRMNVHDEWINQFVGCIEIMDNVAIGSGVQICPNVRIGPNAIIGAGAVVTRDIPANSVAAGVPARVIGSFDEFCKKRIEYSKAHKGLSREQRDEVIWKEFYEARS